MARHFLTAHFKPWFYSTQQRLKD